jgi:hypothetical protein
MITTAQVELVVDLIRKHGRMLRRESFKTLRQINALIRAREANVPESFLLPFSGALQKTIETTRFDKSALPSAVGSLFMSNRRWSDANLAALDRFGIYVCDQCGGKTESTVLAGDGGALSALYQDSGAFPATYWAALLRDGTYAAESRKRMLGFPEDDWSEQIQFGKTSWRKPKPALLITLLAAHLGNPTAPPTPPIWPHLGLALLAWNDRIAVQDILKFAGKLDVLEDVQRGLAISAHIFPELAEWTNLNELWIPGWEKKFAIPLAARRLMMGERE